MYKIILFLIVGFGLIFAYAKYIELRGIFFPTKDIEFNPNYANLAFEDIYIETDDGVKINGWFIPIPNAKYTLLILHGNAGNIADRVDKINLLNKLEYNIFIVDYRGYGRSQGRPSEDGLYTDAKAAYNYLVNERKTNPENIILYGESLGTAVAIELASKVEIKALILEGGFSSGRDMGRVVYPLVPSFLFSDRFNSLKRIKKIKAPILFLHAKDDEIISVNLAKKLFNQALGPKQFVELVGGHNTAFLDSQDKYLFSISSFIDKL